MLREAIRRSFEPVSLGLALSLGRMALGGAFCDGRGRPYLAAFEERTRLPLLVVAGSADRLIPAVHARRAYERSRSGDRTYRCFDVADGGLEWGHIDLIMGKNAPEHVWFAVRNWRRAR